ncbi:hypothetical protein MPB2EB_1551 [Mycoavidus sp. B2-EB]|nr:hypothetical protein MPB2EB_1551 [Mycoavidus sp. B2-EB]
MCLKGRHISPIFTTEQMQSLGPILLVRASRMDPEPVNRSELFGLPLLIGERMSTPNTHRGFYNLCADIRRAAVNHQAFIYCAQPR